VKLALIDDFRPAVLGPGGLVDFGALVPRIMGLPGGLRMTALIEQWSEYRDLVTEAASQTTGVARARLRAPIPRPGKLLCAMLSFREGVADAVVAPAFFLKSSSSVIGPGDTVELNPVDAAVFHHEAELAVVIGKHSKAVTAADARGTIFGYTCFMDLSARGVGPGTGFQDKSYDTFGPMGPWIVTADELGDPHALQVKLWVNDEVRHDYPMSDIGNPISAMIAYASSIAGLDPGDVLAMGVNHQGIGPIQHGDTVRMEIAGIGDFSVGVCDPLRRRWERGIDVGTAKALRDMVRKIPLSGPVQFARRLDP
jgi:2-keto-4-pentenoate hydratase/2-oxohepta-3-ene-1,7-dioic acid hydratase in catechol pathway